MDEDMPHIPHVVYRKNRPLIVKEIIFYARLDAGVQASNGSWIMRRVGREAKEGDEQVKKE
jgi:hypothetical protein